MNVLVLKIGGSVLKSLPDSFYKIIVELKETGKCQPIIVHGGGPEINQALEHYQVETTFVDGLRVTTQEVLDVAEMVLTGSINKQIVANIHKASGLGFGLSGVDGALLTASPIDSTGALGHVGQVDSLNKSWIDLILDQGGIPVISPIGIDTHGQKYNINADMAAAAVAKGFQANLAFISDIPGVLKQTNGNNEIYSQLTKQQIEELIKQGVIYGGMIPKVQSALHVLSAGVKESVILNGQHPQDLQTYIEGNKAGTKIILEEANHV